MMRCILQKKKDETVLKQQERRIQAKKLGLLLPYVKHTKQGHLAIARNITVTNQLWQIDIKYVKALNGQFVMLTDIIDVCSRKIVGREITKTATTDDAIIGVCVSMEQKITT